jgi:carbamoyl-phosphate synthase large subunit
MDNILITAIGSMSAPVVLEILSKNGNWLIIGTDIYPFEWQVNKLFLSKFYQVPKADDKNYVNEMLNICTENDIRYIIPLTDPEVDVLSENRKVFENVNAKLCISNEQTIAICRNKNSIENIFKNNPFVNVINSLSEKEINEDSVYPIIAKPKKGRSSEGLYLLKKKEWLAVIENIDDYVFQSYLKGKIITVDVIRDKKGKNIFIARRELLRTSNGAGSVVEIIKTPLLEQTIAVIIDELNIIGCINIEFLQKDNIFYLMDINPRFSAGIGFSYAAGYDFVNNHLLCFQDKNIADLFTVKEGILTRQTKINYI